MFIEFIKDGKNCKLQTPKKTSFSNVKIRNTKKAIIVSILKTNQRVLRTRKLKKMGQMLLEDKILLQEFHNKKTALFDSSKKRVIIKIKKDENTFVKIQKELF